MSDDRHWSTPFNALAKLNNCRPSVQAVRSAKKGLTTTNVVSWHEGELRQSFLFFLTRSLDYHLTHLSAFLSSLAFFMEYTRWRPNPATKEYWNTSLESMIVEFYDTLLPKRRADIVDGRDSQKSKWRFRLQNFWIVPKFKFRKYVLRTNIHGNPKSILLVIN